MGLLSIFENSKQKSTMAESDECDVADVEPLNSMEMKQFELTEGGGRPTKPSNQHYQHVRRTSSYAAYESPTNTVVYAPPSYTKVYCTAAYQILLHLAIIYCLVCVTYVTFFRSQNCLCTGQFTDSQAVGADNVYTTNVPTSVQGLSVPSVVPTVAPIGGESIGVPVDTTPIPSSAPSNAMTDNPTDASVTSSPTKRPTLQPTLRVYEQCW